MDSAIYICNVMHKRLRPKIHALRHRLFSVWLDLDRLDDLNRRLRLFSIDRRNLISFHQKDRGDGAGALASYVRDMLARHDLASAGHRIMLLTMPRIFGRAFNPLSVYFCYRESGDVGAVLWEVDNTFSERHSYLTAAGNGDVIRVSSAKAFYVSPFAPVDLHYSFLTKPPGERLMLTINVSDDDGLLLVAQQHGFRKDLSDRELLRCLWRWPLQALHVIAAIHWQALRLWIKGVPLVEKPPGHTGLISVHKGAP